MFKNEPLAHFRAALRTFGWCFHKGWQQRETEPQPLEAEHRRNPGPTNLLAPPQTEGAAAVGSCEKLARFITGLLLWRKYSL
jgi:hypothetical protein